MVFFFSGANAGTGWRGTGTADALELWVQQGEAPLVFDTRMVLAVHSPLSQAGRSE